ncbi:MAG: response regulator [Thermoanaerobaculia bacterium]
MPKSGVEIDVLLIEDEMLAAAAVTALLESYSYTVKAACNGREALTILESGCRPALILLDLRMPVMNGFEFCLELERNEAFREMPVAIVSGEGVRKEQLPVRHVDAGVFWKPVDFEKLLTAVRSYCGQPESHTAAAVC